MVWCCLKLWDVNSPFLSFLAFSSVSLSAFFSRFARTVIFPVATREIQQIQTNFPNLFVWLFTVIPQNRTNSTRNGACEFIYAESPWLVILWEIADNRLHNALSIDNRVFSQASAMTVLWHLFNLNPICTISARRALKSFHLARAKHCAATITILILLSFLFQPIHLR